MKKFIITLIAVISVMTTFAQTTSTNDVQFSYNNQKIVTLSYDQCGKVFDLFPKSFQTEVQNVFNQCFVNWDHRTKQFDKVKTHNITVYETICSGVINLVFESNGVTITVLDVDYIKLFDIFNLSFARDTK
jgi:hypothetical protein